MMCVWKCIQGTSSGVRLGVFLGTCPRSEAAGALSRPFSANCISLEAGATLEGACSPTG